MLAAARRNLMATAVLVAGSVVAVTPLAPRPFQLPIRSIETRLVDGSILNVPINLFEDLLNVPYNEVQGWDTAASSLMFGGSWWVPSSTNIWGIDPGDPTHVAAVDSLIAPFPALLNGVGGLNYEEDGFLAAELPASASCDAATCAPIIPGNQITGITFLDRDIGLIQSLLGKAPDGASQLFNGWEQVPLKTLMDGTFRFPTESDPSGVAHSGFGFFNGDGNPFEGGTVGPDNLMPWSGMQFTYNPLQPLENFWTSLMAPVSSGPGVEIPTFTEAFQGLQALAASFVVDFDPFVAGSSGCPAECDGFLSVDSILKLMDPAWSPATPTAGNPIISEWLTSFAAGTVNNATLPQTYTSIALLDTGFFNLTPDQLTTVDADLALINPELPALLTNAGVLTDPGYLNWLADPSLVTNQWDPVYGGLNPSLILPDLLQMLGLEGTSHAVTEAGAALGVLDPMPLFDFGNMVLQLFGL